MNPSVSAERPCLPLPRLREILAHAGGHNFANGLGAFLFAATGPGALILAVPKPFIFAMAGLAMVPVLQSAFVAAFKGPFALGALVTFLVTVAGVTIFNIGAAFWGAGLRLRGVAGSGTRRLCRPGGARR